MGSVVSARRLSSCGTCHSTACGIFLDQGSTRVPCIGKWITIHCTTRKVLDHLHYWIAIIISSANTIATMSYYTQYLIWHSHLLYEVNTIIFPISQRTGARHVTLKEWLSASFMWFTFPSQMINLCQILDSVLKRKDITLLTKVCLVKAMVFPVVTYRCESWTIKKAEGQRIEALEKWCRRRLLKVPWAERRPNQSILKEINLNIHWKDWCWSWSFNTLATWCQELIH